MRDPPKSHGSSETRIEEDRGAVFLRSARKLRTGAAICNTPKNSRFSSEASSSSCFYAEIIARMIYETLWQSQEKGVATSHFSVATWFR
jgi:hypothetical protein